MVRMETPKKSTLRDYAPSTSPADIGLVKKGEVARAAEISVRTVENLMKAKRIPFVRLSARCVRFHLPSVLAALRRYEIREISAPGWKRAGTHL
jgi:hypothetical protein